MESSVARQVVIGGAYELGGKMTQEDYLVCILDMNQYIPTALAPSSDSNHVKRSFCAVFDGKLLISLSPLAVDCLTGHGGESASKFLATHFHLKLARHPKFCLQPLTALQETWQQAEDELKDFCTSGEKILKDGSTATVCLIVSGSLYIANCGDSSGYLQMVDGTITRATDLHNTLNSAEVQRCTSAGAEIRLKEGPRGLFSCCGPFRVQPISIELQQPRVYPGGLLITRSFGDFYAKDPMLGGIPGSVICDPGQIRFFNLSEVKYIVLASDGVWDALEPDTVFKIIDDCLQDHISHHKLQPSACSVEVLGLRYVLSLHPSFTSLGRTQFLAISSPREERSATSTLPLPMRSAIRRSQPLFGRD